MGARERKEKHKTELRARILEAARDLFTSDGIGRVSMRRIAERVEYTPKTLYLYFRNKSDILAHLCEQTYARLAVEVEALQEMHADPVALLRAGLRAYVEFGQRNPNDYKVAFLGEARYYPHRGQEELPRDSAAWQLQCMLDGTVARCIESGRFRRMDVPIVSHALWAAVHGLTSMLVLDPGYRWTDKNALIDVTIDMMLRGLEAKPR